MIELGIAIVMASKPPGKNAKLSRVESEVAAEQAMVDASKDPCGPHRSLVTRRPTC
jgi:hypothetical protein